MRKIQKSILWVLFLMLPAQQAVFAEVRLKPGKNDLLQVKNLPADISVPVSHRKVAIIIEEDPAESVNESIVNTQLRIKAGEILEGKLREFLNQDGFVIVERSKLEEILKEQWLQLTGIIGAEKASELGKIAEVTDFLFGRITTIDVLEEAPSSRVEGLQKQWQYIVKVGVDLRIVNVKSASILASVTKNKTRNGAANTRHGVSLHDLLTKAISSAVDDSVPELQRGFPLQGYITALRGNRKYVLINLGKEHGIREKKKFRVYEVNEIPDVSGQMQVIKKFITTIKVFQVDEKSSWAKARTRDHLLIGQTVEEIPDKRSRGHKVLRGIKDSGR